MDGNVDLFISPDLHERPTEYAHSYRGMLVFANCYADTLVTGAAAEKGSSVVASLRGGKPTTFSVSVRGKEGGGTFKLHAKTHSAMSMLSVMLPAE